MLFRHSADLLDQSTDTNQGVVGQTYRIQPVDSDGVRDTEQAYRAVLFAQQTGGTTGPTTDVRLETSVDKTRWVSVAAATQLTQDGSVVEVKEPTALGPFVRAVTQLGGVVKPNHKAKVSLVSNGPFKLVKVT
jgi:hypothetical protein